MKKILSLLLIAALLFAAFSVPVWAEEYSGECGENLTWAFDSDTGELTISGSGDMTDFYEHAPWDWCFDPSEIQKINLPLGIKSIGEYAFANTEIRTIDIPAEVTDIGYYAFYGCWSLRSVRLPNTVEFIDSFAFDECSELSDVFFLGTEAEWNKITIGNGNNPLLEADIHFTSYTGECGDDVKWAFDPNTGELSITGTGDTDDYYVGYAPWVSILTKIKSIKVGEGVTRLGSEALLGCDNLEKVSLPNSLIDMGSGVFIYCSSLQSITLPRDVRALPPDLFRDCSGLQHIVLPEGVSYIGNQAFYNCTSLQSIFVPAAVTEIGFFAFSECTQLQDVFFEGSQEEWAQIEIGTGNDSLFAATIHYNTTPTPANDESQDSSTASSEESMPPHEDPSTPDGPSSPSKKKDCGPNLKWSLLLGVLTISGTGEMYDYSVNNPAPWSGKKVNAVIVRKGVTSVGDFAFAFLNTRTLSLPDSLEKIGSYSFYNCSNLRKVTIPECVREIEKGSFSGCGSLRSVNLSGGIQKIGEGVFKNCSALGKITIPQSVHEMGPFVFEACSSMEDIYCEASAMPTRWADQWRDYCYAQVHWAGVSEFFEYKGTFSYDSHWIPGNDTADCFYSDVFFNKTGYIYDHSLAKMSLSMAMASIGSYKGLIEDGSANIRDLYGKLDFANELDCHYVKPTSSTIGYVIGSKDIHTNDGDCTLIAVTIRSGGYGAEWASNFTMGSSGDHKGFSKAANEVIAGIKDYISRNKSKLKETLKVWICGFSRGGAVANLSAAYLDHDAMDGEIPGLTPKDIYAYGFAVPLGAEKKDITKYDGKYLTDNIFSIVNDFDFVTKVAPTADGFDFTRYGIEYHTPTATNMTYNDYLSADKTMQKEYQTLIHKASNNPFPVNPLQSEAYDLLLTGIAEAIGTRREYAQPDFEPELAEIISSFFAGTLSTNISVRLDGKTVISIGEAGLTFPSPDGDNGTEAVNTLFQKIVQVLTQGVDLISDFAKCKSVEIDVDKYTLKLTGAQAKEIINTFATFVNFLKENGKLSQTIVKILFKDGKITDKALHELMLDNIGPSHYPELYYAWMASVNSFGIQGSVRQMEIHCPVDVAVYDSSAKKAASITDKNGSAKIKKENVFCYIDSDGAKVFILPVNEEYTAAIDAYTAGEVSCIIKEYAPHGTECIKCTEFETVLVNGGDSLDCKAEFVQPDKDAADYTLTAKSGKISSNVFSGEEAEARDKEKIILSVEDHPEMITVTSAANSLIVWISCGALVLCGGIFAVLLLNKKKRLKQESIVSNTVSEPSK